MPHRTIARAALAIAALLALPASASTVFKWTDERGVVNYSTAPPPQARKVVAVNAAPALEAHMSAEDEEGRYWRERRQRETLRELEEARERRETRALREAQLRHSQSLATQAAMRDDEARRAWREQCLRERRVDCDAPSSWTTAYVPAPVVVRRFAPQPITRAAPFPVSGPTLGPAPGTIAGTQAQLAPFRQGVDLTPGAASLRTQ